MPDLPPQAGCRHVHGRLHCSICVPSTGVTVQVYLRGHFNVGAGNPNLGPLACRVSATPTDLFTQPFNDRSWLFSGDVKPPSSGVPCGQDVVAVICRRKVRRSHDKDSENVLWTGFTADIAYIAKLFRDAGVVSEESRECCCKRRDTAEGCPLSRARIRACARRSHRGGAHQGCLPNPASEADPCPVLCVGAAVAHRHCCSCGDLACARAESPV